LAGRVPSRNGVTKQPLTNIGNDLPDPMWQTEPQEITKDCGVVNEDEWDTEDEDVRSIFDNEAEEDEIETVTCVEKRPTHSADYLWRTPPSISDARVPKMISRTHCIHDAILGMATKTRISAYS
jgi:hypothetical protein